MSSRGQAEGEEKTGPCAAEESGGCDGLQHMNFAGGAVVHTLGDYDFDRLALRANSHPNCRRGLPFPVSAINMHTSIYTIHKTTPFTTINTISVRTAVAYSSRFTRRISSYSTGRSGSPMVGFSYSFPK